VVLEASTGSFWWADQIEAKGAKCFVNECHGVPWLRIRGSFGLSRTRGTRRTGRMRATWRRRCGCTWSRGSSGSRWCTSRRGWCGNCGGCSQYCLLNRQIATHKNNAQAIFVENGVELKRELKCRLFAPESGLEL
jgi:hypothetical protein